MAGFRPPPGAFENLYRGIDGCTTRGRRGVPRVNRYAIEPAGGRLALRYDTRHGGSGTVPRRGQSRVGPAVAMQQQRPARIRIRRR